MKFKKTKVLILLILYYSIINNIFSCSPAIAKIQKIAHSSKINIENLECIINLTGINSIIVDSSNFIDVVKTFGKGQILHKWEFDGFFSLGFFEIRFPYRKFFLKYKDIGLVFWGFRVKKEIKVYGIHLNNVCPCKTIENIGIGDSHSKVINTYGKEFHFYYARSGHYGLVFEKRVFGLTSKDTSTAVIHYIDIQ